MRRFTKRASKKELAKFAAACGMLQELCDAGFDTYIAASGSFHLMNGPSHDDDQSAHRERSLAVHNVDRASGGDW